ncbi:MAG TPA: molybdopterin oxidoreductase, partial [Terriglobia bacterium]|nr:molybdopterin oxidoreductase [Terriglobia bacterium]
MNRVAAAEVRTDLLRPLFRTSARFYVVAALLGSVVMAGFGAWIYQVYDGLGITGDNWPVFWGFHETNFVFWI